MAEMTLGTVEAKFADIIKPEELKAALELIENFKK